MVEREEIMVVPAKKWKIVSDGTSHGTKIISPSGEVVGMVQKLSIVIECGEPFVKADMSVILPQLDVDVLDSSFSNNLADCDNCTPACINGLAAQERFAKYRAEGKKEG